MDKNNYTQLELEKKLKDEIITIVKSEQYKHLPLIITVNGEHLVIQNKIFQLKIMNIDTAGNQILEFNPNCDCGLTSGCEKCRPIYISDDF